MNRFKLNTRSFKWALLMCVAFAAVLGIFMHHAHAAGTAGVLATTAGAMTDQEFQTKVLKSTEELVTENSRLKKEQGELKSSYQKVLDDLDRSDKEVKKALEDLTKVKNSCNDFDATIKAMEKAHKAIALNARSSFKDPIAKSLANEETRAYFNAVGRMAANKGDTGKLPAELKALIEKANVEAKAMSGVDTSLGQATVPIVTFDEIYDNLLEYGQWSSLGVMRVGARTNVLPVATARPNFYWIGSGTGGAGETSAITESDMAGSSVNLTIQTLAVYLTIARELLADSTVDLAPYLMKQMIQSISFGLDTAAFIGNGNADQTNAGYYGIFNVASVNTNLAATATVGNTTVGATQLEDWVNVLLTVSPEVLNRKPKWWIHPQMLARASLIRDKNGRPLFQTWLEVPNPGSIGSILGYPVIPTAVAPSTDGAGNTVAAFGDGEGQAVGIRQDMEFATSDDILFAQNMRAFRALMRAGVKPKTIAASNTLKPIAVLTLPAA